MSSTQHIGTTVRVRDTAYTIANIENMSHLGSKFFGTSRFTLRSAAGATFTAYGKRVAHNSRLRLERPAPPTDAEIDAAYAEDTARTVERTRCDHVADAPGCVHIECPGVPPADGATTVEPVASDVPTPAEYGTQTVAREIRDALRGYPTLTQVTMPRVTVSEGAPGVRRFTVATAQVDGHAVSVIMWEGAHYRPLTAITVDGTMIAADVTNGRAVINADRARMVAWRVADTLRDAAPVATVPAPVAQVEPVAPSGRLVERVAALNARTDALATRTDALAARLESPTPPVVEPVAQDDTPATIPTVPAESESTMPTVTATTPAQVEPVAPVPVGPLAVSVDRDALADALALAVWGAPSRPSVPMLAGVMLTAHADGLELGATDFDVSTRTTLPADVTRPGRVLVAAKALRDVVRAFPKVTRPRRGQALPAGAGRVRLTATGDALTVEYGPTCLTLPTMPAEDFPTLPETGRVVANVSARTLAETVARIATAVGTEPTLPTLCGVHVTVSADGRAELAATDRYRLALDTLPWFPVVPDGTDPREIIAPALIPGAVLAYAAKLVGKIGGKGDAPIPVKIAYTMTSGYSGKVPVTVAGSVAIMCGPVTITTRCIDGEFPQVRALLPDTYAASAQVDAAALASVVERVGKLADKSDPVRLTWGADAVTVAIGGTDGPTASESLPCVSDTDPGFTTGFNPTYLAEALRAFPAGPVTLQFNASRKPVVIMSDDAPTYRHLIMPIRIGDTGSTPAASGPARPAQVNAAAPAPVAQVDTPAPVESAAPVDAEPVADAPAPVEPVADVVPVGTVVTVAGFSAGTGTVASTDAAGRVVVDHGGEMSHVPADRVAPVADAAPVEPTAGTPDADAVLVARVAEILRTGAWSTAVVTVGRGRGRAAVGFDVLKLDAGRLARAEYLAVRDTLRTLGGAWNRDAKGFVFEPSRAQFTGGYSTRGADALAAWLDRNAPQVAAEPAAPAVEPVAQVEPEPVADAVPAVMVRALALTVGERVSVSGADGNGYPVQRTGYVTAEPHDAGHRGVWVRLASNPDGAGRPVYVRDGSTLATLAADAVEPVADAVPAAQVEPVAPAGQLHDATERAAHVAYERMTAGNFSAARSKLAEVAGIAPAGYLIAGRFTVGELADMIDAAERAAQSAPEPVEPSPAPAVEPQPVPAQVAPAVEPQPVPAQVAPAVEPPAAAAQVDASGPLVFTLAPYSAEVGMSYKASRKAIHAAIRAAKLRAVVHAVEGDRRGVRVECDADDRATVAEIVRATVALVDLVPVSV